jgi:hypothetical protein
MICLFLTKQSLPGTFASVGFQFKLSQHRCLRIVILRQRKRQIIIETKPDAEHIPSSKHSEAISASV